MPGTSNMHFPQAGSCENSLQDEVTGEIFYTARMPAKLHLVLLVTTVRNMDMKTWTIRVDFES